VLGSCKSLWFEPWFPTTRAVVESEQAFNAVIFFDELGACDVWTGNRSMMYVLAVSQSCVALFSIAISSMRGLPALAQHEKSGVGNLNIVFTGSEYSIFP
jgi:hypothetical protein